MVSHGVMLYLSKEMLEEPQSSSMAIQSTSMALQSSSVAQRAKPTTASESGESNEDQVGYCLLINVTVSLVLNTKNN